MFRNLVVCDRCGEECVGSTYYTIDIYGKDINPSIGISFETALQNTETNCNKIFANEKHYCKKCIESIKNYISTRKEK